MKVTRGFSMAAAAVAAALAGPLLAQPSVTSLAVATETWNRESARVQLGGGAMQLELVFELERPAPPAPPPGQLQIPRRAASLTAAIAYRKGGLAAPAGHVAGLEKLLDGSEWLDVPDLEAARVQRFPDEALPRSRLLRGVKANNEYRVHSASRPDSAVPFLEALLKQERPLYVMRRQYPGQIRDAGVRPPEVLFEAPKEPRLEEADRPDHFPPIAREVKAETDLILHFDMRYDHVVFEAAKLTVTTSEAAEGVVVLLKCSDVALQDETDRDGVAEFDLGPRDEPGEWHYVAGVGNPVPADLAMPVDGYLLATVPGKEIGAVGPGMPDPIDAEGLAEQLGWTCVRQGLGDSGRLSPPPELMGLLFSHRADRRYPVPWKGHPFWTDASRRAGIASGDAMAWLDSVHRDVVADWVDARAGQPMSEGPTGWSERDAWTLLARLRRFEISGTESDLASAREAAGWLTPRVLAAPAPSDAGGESLRQIEGVCLASLAFYKAYDVLKNTAYRRLAFEQARALLEERLKELLPAKPGKDAAAFLRAHALAIQSLERAWRVASKPPQKKALDELRAKVLATWDAKLGAFALQGGTRPDMNAQYWGLLAFEYTWYPFWELESRDWLR